MDPKECESDADKLLRKRRTAIAAVKRAPEYAAYQATRELREALGLTRAKTPDPTDTNLSKRQWERSVQDWRKLLQDEDDERAPRVRYQ